MAEPAAKVGTMREILPRAAVAERARMERPLLAMRAPRTKSTNPPVPLI